MMRQFLLTSIIAIFIMGCMPDQKLAPHPFSGQLVDVSKQVLLSDMYLRETLSEIAETIKCTEKNKSCTYNLPVSYSISDNGLRIVETYNQSETYMLKITHLVRMQIFEADFFSRYLVEAILKKESFSEQERLDYFLRRPSAKAYPVAKLYASLNTIKICIGGAMTTGRCGYHSNQNTSGLAIGSPESGCHIVTFDFQDQSQQTRLFIQQNVAAICTKLLSVF